MTRQHRLFSQSQIQFSTWVQFICTIPPIILTAGRVIYSVHLIRALFQLLESLNAFLSSCTFYFYRETTSTARSWSLETCNQNSKLLFIFFRTGGGPAHRLRTTCHLRSQCLNYGCLRKHSIFHWGRNLNAIVTLS